MATKKKNTATKKKAPAKKAGKRAAATVAETPAASSLIPAQLQEFLKQTAVPKGFVASKQLALSDLRNRVTQLNVRPTVPIEQLVASANRIKPAPTVTVKIARPGSR